MCQITFLYLPGLQTWLSCWDGVNLDSSDHQSHVAYPSSGTFESDGPCIYFSSRYLPSPGSSDWLGCNRSFNTPCKDPPAFLRDSLEYCALQRSISLAWGWFSAIRVELRWSVSYKSPPISEFLPLSNFFLELVMELTAITFLAGRVMLFRRQWIVIATSPVHSLRPRLSRRPMNALSSQLLVKRLMDVSYIFYNDGCLLINGDF